MGSLSKPSVSIVIPAYNEERRLPLAIRDMRGFFGPSQTSLEFVVVIEKSKDHTVDAAHKAIDGDTRFRVIANDVQRGKGFAVKTGMLQAQGDIVFFMDADLSTPLVEIGTFLSILMSDPTVDIVIGSRAEAKSQILKKQTWIRRNLGRGFNHLVQAAGIRGIKDTQCGFKAFRRRTIEPIFTRQTIDGFAFDVEVLLLARKLGFNIVTQPVRWMNSPDSKVRIWIDPLKMLWDLIKVRWIVRQTLKVKSPGSTP
ncbi:MAG: glycosyltransferase family 2 protein [Bdellovibrionales bacterium]|nr:glycosyltransferase family 2 protein [Bdellovibrionales bacterium]